MPLESPTPSDKSQSTSTVDNTIQRTRNSFRTIYVIFMRELRSYLATPFGWVIFACTMGLQAFSLQAVLKIMSIGSDEGIMYHMLDNMTFWFYFIFLIPLITMRSFAEEERMGTLEGLLTAPVTTTHILLGKYLAAYVFYILIWMPMMLYPWLSDLANSLTMTFYNIQSTGAIEYRLADWYGAFGILFLTGSFFIALGILCSALTRSQIIAAIVCTCMMITYYFMGVVTDLWGEFPAAGLFHYISITDQISSFSRGLIDSRPFVLYISMTIFTLALTRRIVDYRRWRR